MEQNPASSPSAPVQATQPPLETASASPPVAVEQAQMPPTATTPRNKLPLILAEVALFLLIVIGGLAYYVFVYNSPVIVVKRAMNNYVKSFSKMAYKTEIDIGMTFSKKDAASLSMLGLGQKIGAHISAGVAQDIRSKDDARVAVNLTAAKLKLSDLLELSLYPDLEYRLVKDKGYFKIGNLPDQLSAYSSFKNQWFYTDESKKNLGADDKKAVSTLSDAENKKLLNDFTDTYKVISVVKGKGEEVDKVKTQKYDIGVNKDKMLQWYKNSYEPIMKKNGETDQNLASNEAILKKLDPQEMSLWVGPGDTLKKSHVKGRYKEESFALNLAIDVVTIQFKDAIEPPKDAKEWALSTSSLMPNPYAAPTSPPVRYGSPTPYPNIRYPTDYPVSTGAATLQGAQNCEYIKAGMGTKYTSQQYSQCLQQQTVLGAWIKKI